MNIGGLFKSLLNPANLALLAAGPAGWAQLAIKEIGSQIAMAVIKELGQKLGLPPSLISMAQQAFGAATGQPGLRAENLGDTVARFAAEAGMSAVETATAQRNAQQTVKNLVGSFIPPKKGEEEEGGSFLVALAKAMGKVMDKKMMKMNDLSVDLQTFANRSGDPKKGEEIKLGSINSLMQAYSQELSILSTAFATIAKSIGEAQATSARKS